jgi:hypothetical protein
VLELDQHVVQLIPPFPVRRISECEWSVLLSLFGVVRLIFGFLILLLLTNNKTLLKAAYHDSLQQFSVMNVVSFPKFYCDWE